MTEAPKRPALVGKLIDLNLKRDEETKETYGKFLQLAKQSADVCSISKIAIKSTFKVVGSMVDDDKDKNDSLMQIFLFYRKIYQQHRRIFNPFDLTTATWTYNDVVLFFRDFELIPKLLSVEDIKFIWEMKDVDWTNEHGPTAHMMTLDFHHFKDFLVRMALCAYHKPGLKKLIITMNGVMPKNSQIVQCFCTLLHLYDNDWIQNVIRTVGRETQGEYNFRSKDEKNSRARVEVAQDLEAKALSQVDYSRRLRSALSTESIVGGIIAARSGGKNMFGEKLKIPSVTAPASVNNVVHPGLRKSYGKSNLKTTSLPEHLLYKIDHFDFNKDSDGKSTAEEDIPLEDEFAIKATVSYNNNKEKHGSNSSRDDLDESDPALMRSGSESSSTFDNEKGIYPESTLKKMTHSPSLLTVFKDNSIHALKRAIRADYDPELINQFDKFCYTKPRVFETEPLSTGGPFVDLGLLEVGNEVSMLFKVTNNTGDVIRIDATARDFESDDTKVSTYPNPLVHGFTRTITVTFTVQSSQKRSIIAFIEVAAVSSRGVSYVLIDCPVHYRVDPQTKRDILPAANQATLPHLLTLKKYNTLPEDVESRTVRADYRGLSLTFEKKNIPAVSWNTRTQTLQSLTTAINTINNTTTTTNSVNNTNVSHNPKNKY